MEKFKYQRLSKNRIPQLPKTSGVYCFKGNREFLYVGKASNIKERVKNHFSPRRSFSGGGSETLKDSLFAERASKIGYIKTDSEIEALVLEANLIKKYQPKYNVVWRDDKNYFFVGITEEDYPQVFIAHQPRPQNAKYKIRNTNFLGPFVDGQVLKQALKVLRRIFPYRTCKTLPKRPCLWYQLDRCPAPCLLKSPLGKQLERFTKSISLKRECQRNVRNLTQILQGRKRQALKSLKKKMNEASASKAYERAAKFRDQIESLERVLENARIFGPAETTVKYHHGHGLGLTAVWRKTENELKKILKSRKEISRIEAYDVSNLQGQEATGSMITFIKGQPEKNFYRRFKIKIGGRPNDIAMLKEVLERRFSRQEWPYPDLILIDGGKPQLNAAIKAKRGKREAKNIFIAALAKKENKLFIEERKRPVLLKNLPREIFNLILRLRDEAHRFALSYHRKLRQRALFEK